MVLPLVVGALVLSIGVPVGVRALLQRRAKSADVSASIGPAAAGEDGSAAGAEELEPSGGANIGGVIDAAKTLKNVLPAGAGAAAATVAAGLVASAATGQVVDKVLGHGEGRGKAATVIGISALPAAIGAKLGEKAAEAIGLGKEAQKDVGHLSAALVVAPPVAVAVGGAKLLLAGVNAIAPGVGDTVSKALSSLDPTRTDTVTGKVVGAVADGVSGAARILTGGLLGGKSDEEKRREEAEKEAARQKAAAALSSGAVTTAQIAKAVRGPINVRGLVNLGKAVNAAPPPPPPAPAPVPAGKPKFPGSAAAWRILPASMKRAFSPP